LSHAFSVFMSMFSFWLTNNQMRLTVPTKTHCCCLTCVRTTYSRTKKSTRWQSLDIWDITFKVEQNRKIMSWHLGLRWKMKYFRKTEKMLPQPLFFQRLSLLFHMKNETCKFLKIEIIMLFFESRSIFWKSWWSFTKY
jgi:hypothetical protein